MASPNPIAARISVAAPPSARSSSTDPVTGAAVARMALRRLVDPRRVAADRRRAAPARPCRRRSTSGRASARSSRMPRARSSRCQRQAIGQTESGHDRDRAEEVARARVAEDVQRLADVDLPEDVGDTEAGDDDPGRDFTGGAGTRPLERRMRRRRETVGSVLTTPGEPPRARGAARRSRPRCPASECAGESGSESTSSPGPLGDRQRRLPGIALAVRAQPVDGQEVDARPDPLVRERALVLVARRAGPLGVDADDVEVERVRVARVARERLDAVEVGDARVVGGDVAQRGSRGAARACRAGRARSRRARRRGSPCSRARRCRRASRRRGA